MTVPPDPRAPYVEVAELARLLGVPEDDPRLVRVTESVSQIVDRYYGKLTVAAHLIEPPWPPALTEAALTIAADLWRRPAAPAGYFQIVDFVGRLALDPASPVATLLDSAIPRERWPIA